MEDPAQFGNDAVQEAVEKRRLRFWVIAATLALTMLLITMFWYGKTEARRWSFVLAGDPATGARLFFGKKECSRCHSISGSGGKLAPDLGDQADPQSGIGQLVTAMWNHAPRMWERMRMERVRYPDLCNEEMAHLFAFLYTARYIDEPGDQSRGRVLFDRKGCQRCHAIRGEGGDVGPDLASVNVLSTPLRWAQAMWNHAPAMQQDARRLNIPWPKFQGREMNDLMAYIRQISGGIRRERELLPASAERGWKVFQSKSCIACHAVRGRGGNLGPELGPGRKLPLTFVQFAGLMWNHSPEMWEALRKNSIPHPKFEGQEVADLVAFLSSLRYFEPAGSPVVGQTLFAERGCDYCHGKQAEGSRTGPALRGPGEITTSITLATALWGHGPKMYDRTRQLGRPWPTLSENDIGDLVAFLNTPREAR